MFRLAIQLALACFFFLPSFSQGGWELEKDDEGIKVYTREVEGSGFRQYRVMAVMEGTIEGLTEIIRDVGNYPDVFSNVDNSYSLELSDSILIYYMISDAPWPVKDRDAIVRLDFLQGPESDFLEIKSQALPGYLEQKRGYLRLKKIEGSWEVQVLDGGEMDVTLTMHTEPGGMVPSWLANRVIVDGPFEDFKRIKGLLKKNTD